MCYPVKVHYLLAFSLFGGLTFLPLTGQREPGGREPGEANPLDFSLPRMLSPGVGSLWEPVCLSPGHSESQPWRLEGPWRSITTLCKGPSRCREAGMELGGRLVPRTNSGAMQSSVNSFAVSSVSLRLWSLPLTQATYCICVCSEHAHQWLWRGPPGNHSHHSLGTAFSSHRKNTQRPLLICRHWWGPPGSWNTCGQLRREHGNSSALLGQGSATHLCTCPVCNIYQQPSFILLFPAFHFKTK